MKFQMIPTIESCNKKLSLADKNAISKLAFVGIDLSNSSSEDFALNNGWTVSDNSSMFGASYTSFSLAQGNGYYSYFCKDCKSMFNSPMIEKISSCIICNSLNLDSKKKKIQRAEIQENMTIHPDLYKQSIEDIKAHPPKQEENIDWQHLADTIGD